MSNPTMPREPRHEADRPKVFDCNAAADALMSRLAEAQRDGVACERYVTELLRGCGAQHKPLPYDLAEAAHELLAKLAAREDSVLAQTATYLDTMADNGGLDHSECHELADRMRRFSLTPAAPVPDELLEWAATNPRLARQVILGRGAIFGAGAHLFTLLKALRRTNEHVGEPAAPGPVGAETIDAARYRWMRKHEWIIDALGDLMENDEIETAEDMDEAIDRDLSEQPR